MSVATLSPDRPDPSSEPAAEPRLGTPRRLLLRGLHLWFRLRRGMTLGVRAIVLDGEGRVFLVRHSYVPGWHLPGGGVETGQSALEALATELAEEGNIEMLAEPRLLGVYFNRRISQRDHVLLYELGAFRQSAPRLPDREIVEAGFFPLDALPAGTTRATRDRLAERAGNRPPSAFW